MVTLQRLKTLYLAVLMFLVITLLIAAALFNDLYLNSINVTELIENILAKREPLSTAESHELSVSLSTVEQTRTRGYIFFIAVLLLLSGGALALLFIYRRNVVEPVSRITEATKKITEGKFEGIPVSENKTEIGMLAENVNLMGHALQGKIKELEESVLKEQRVTRRLNILNEIIGSLIFKLELNDVLTNIMSNSKVLVKSEYSIVALLDRLTHKTTHLISSFPDNDIDIGSLAGNTMKEILSSKMPLRSSSEDRIKALLERDSAYIGDLHLRNMLAVPIVIEGAVCGAVILCNRAGDSEFTTEDEDTALMFTIQSGIAIDRSLFHERVMHLAKTDGLTGLNNHRTFYEILGMELRRSRRYNRNLSLLMIDIDDFKKFNDTYGHQAGDAILKRLADVLLKNLRAIDSAARYGGEEFAVILPETPLDAAAAIAERIRDEASRSLCISRDEGLCITVSLGVSVFPEDSIDKDGLIKAADDALYMTKRVGKNKVITYQDYKIASKK
ncbi:MAG: sensor domain-containing diguanylate cyclase [Nitrospirae bacterium]|nr:sensor domain-containing diguanylate cyclase [Nitrospirota bacterium]